MLTKEECLKAYEKLKYDHYFITEDDDGNLIHIDDLYKNELNLFKNLINEHFALIELLGLNKEYEKAGVEDKEQLKKLIEDNHKLWEHAAKYFNEERIKYLQDQIELLEKEINYDNRKQVEE